MSRSYTTQGIILKRINYGEYDRIVTVLTRERGKHACIAKGARKLTSSKRAMLEPGNYVRVFCVETKSMPILTQAVLLENTAAMTHSLTAYRNVSQLLEILEKLFVEEAIDEELFEQVLGLRSAVLQQQGGPGVVRQQLGALIAALGFQHPDESDHATVSDYLEALLAQPLRSFEFLRVS